MKSICFTGHRNITVTLKLKKKLYRTVENLICQDATDFYSGSMPGWDILCEKTVIKLSRKYPQIRLHFIFLNCERIWTYSRSSGKKNLFYNEVLSADMSKRHSGSDEDIIAKRNEKLVELADCCVCYYNEKDCAGGTGQTVRMAQKKGIEIINLFG